MEAYLSAIFNSVEGEGAGAGRRAFFVRFAGCNLACSYCDTPEARERPGSFEFHGRGGVERIPNPFDCGRIAGMIEASRAGANLAVLTGGEPLLQPEAVAYIGRRMKEAGLAVQLETNGTLAAALSGVMDTVDTVSMDVKLPVTQGGRDLGSTHRDFLSLVPPGRVVVKIVVPEEARDEEVLDGVRLVAGVDPRIPVFIQPVFTGGRPCVVGDRLLDLLERASRIVAEPKLSVQMHKILGFR
jgi:7-carboxy-7-deazaguanine synthase